MTALDVEQIVGSIGPGVGIALTVCTTNGTVGRIVALADITGECLAQELYMLDTEVALDGQSLDGHNVNIGIAEDAP